MLNEIKTQVLAEGTVGSIEWNIVSRGSISLNINGSGSFDIHGEDAPWKDCASDIEVINVGDGIDGMNPDIFSGLPKVRNINIWNPDLLWAPSGIENREAEIKWRTHVEVRKEDRDSSEFWKELYWAAPYGCASNTGEWLLVSPTFEVRMPDEIIFAREIPEYLYSSKLSKRTFEKVGAFLEASKLYEALIQYLYDKQGKIQYNKIWHEIQVNV